MAKAHPAVDLDQASRLGRLERRAGDPEPLGRPPQKRRVAERLRRRDQQNRWVSAGSASSRFTKLSSILPDNDSAAGNPNPPASCAAESPRGSSNSANGLPRVSANSSSATRSSSRPGITDTNSDRASASSKTLDNQPRQTRQQVALLARGEQHHHRLRQQPSRHERHTLRRRPV